MRFSCWLPFYSTIANRYEQPMHPSMPPWHADEIGAGWRSQTIGGNIQGDGWRLRRSGHAEFSLPRSGQGHFQFYSIEFHVTHRFFVTFFTEESNVSLVPRLLSLIRKWGRRQVPRPQSNQSRNSSRSVTPNSLAMARRSSSVMVCSTGLPLASTSM